MLRRLDFEGQFSTARKVGSRVTLVVESWPRYYAQDLDEGFGELDIMPLHRDVHASAPNAAAAAAGSSELLWAAAAGLFQGESWVLQP